MTPDSQGNNTRAADTRSAGASSEIGTEALSSPGAPADTSAAQGRDLDVQLEMELELRRLLITAERALHEIAENTARASNQHRARALLALEEIEERHAE